MKLIEKLVLFVMTTKLNEELLQLKLNIEKIYSSTRTDDSYTNQLLFTQLNFISSIVSSDDKSSSDQSNGVSTVDLAILEELCSNKRHILSKGLQHIVLRIYSGVVQNSSGSIVRSALNSMIGICNNKTLSNSSKECAISIIGEIYQRKSKDCNSQVTETIQMLSKMLKSTNEATMKMSILKCLSLIIHGVGPSMGDLHLELFKLASKFIVEKFPEIRYLVSIVISAIIKNSNGCTTVSTEILLPILSKGLEDDIGSVQDSFACTIASVFSEQIEVFLQTQEQAKFGAARGGEGSGSKKLPTSTSSRLTLSRLTSVKKIVDEYELQSVLNYVIQQCVKSTSVNMRVGWVLALGYLTRDCILYLNISPDEFEWLMTSIIGILKESNISALSFEELGYLRTRLSNMLRSNVTCFLNESKLIGFGSLLCKFVATMESRTEQETFFAVTELTHIISILGPAACSIVDEVNGSTTALLRHASFGVRSSAAQALTQVAVMIPGVATDLLKASLLNTRTQVKQLLIFDGTEVTGFDLSLDDTMVAPNSANSSTNSMDNKSNHNSNSPMDTATSQNGKKKTPRETERLQRMYFFHGHTLVISSILKNLKNIPNGLPNHLVLELYDLGLELFQQDIFSVPTVGRNVCCSIMRAGSLIVSSCLTMGFPTARLRLNEVLKRCNVMFNLSTRDAEVNSTDGGMNQTAIKKSSSSLPRAATSDHEMIYEIMSLEAALVCISTILLFCPDSLTAIPNCHSIIVDGLELSFRALKGKYQPKLPLHFRFRTLHVILLECFAWLPQGSYPNSIQQLFVESLRVFRDGITSGYECTGLMEFVAIEQNILRIGTFNSSIVLSTCGLSTGVIGSAATTASANMSVSNSSVSGAHSELLMMEELYMTKLEQLTVALQKKESEAFLAVFGKDNFPTLNMGTFLSTNTNLQANDLKCSIVNPTAPCVQIESRTIDASILLLAATFAYQTNEYQNKAVQLCVHALTQVIKLSVSSSRSSTSSLGLFTSDDERRRKDKKVITTIRNVLTALCSIIRRYPQQLMSSNIALIHDQNMNSKGNAAQSKRGSGNESNISAVGDEIWFTNITDLLYDLMGNPVFSIKCSAANALATWCGKLLNISTPSEISTVSTATDRSFNTTLMTSILSVCNRIRSSIIAALAKKNDIIASPEYSGYMVALSSIWTVLNDNSYRNKKSDDINLKQVEEDVKSVVLTSVFDCLRRPDYSAYFRSHVMYTLSSIINESFLKLYDASVLNGQGDEWDLLDKICHITETSAASITSYEDQDTLLLALIRLVSVSMAFSIKAGNIRTELNKANSITTKFLNVWKFLKSFAESKNGSNFTPSNRLVSNFVHNELAELLSYVIPHDAANTFFSFILNEFYYILERRSNYSFISMYSVVKAITPLLNKFPNETCKLNLHSKLFELLDNCQSSKAKVSSPSLFTTIEIRRGVLNDEMQDRVLEDLIGAIKDSLMQLITADVATNPDQRIGYWILYLRGIAINLGSTVGTYVRENISGMDDKATAGGEEGVDSFIGSSGGMDEGGFEESTSKSKKSSKTANISNPSDKSNSNRSFAGPNADLLQVLTFDKYVIFRRDQVLLNFPEIPYCDVDLKSFALKAILHCLLICKHQLGVVHFDLYLARQQTNAYLESLSDRSMEKLLDGPTYASLFLNELVNMSCACATFTIEDKTVPTIQVEAIKLIYVIVEMFGDTLDPDSSYAVDWYSKASVLEKVKHDVLTLKSETKNGIIDGLIAESYISIEPTLHQLIIFKNTNNQKTPSIFPTLSSPEDKLLQQYVSQLLSAVRSCQLAEKNSKILISTGLVVCDMVRSGFINDKVILKRLLKPFTIYCEENSSSSGDKNESCIQISLRPKEIVSVSEVVSTSEHIGVLIIIAKMILLAMGIYIPSQISDKVKAAIVATWKDFFPSLRRVWIAIVLDYARMMETISYVHSDINIPNKFLGASSSFDHLLAHPDRGGYTYRPGVNYMELEWIYRLAIPTCFAAQSALSSLESFAKMSSSPTTFDELLSNANPQILLVIAMKHFINIQTVSNLDEPRALLNQRLEKDILIMGITNILRQSCVSGKSPIERLLLHQIIHTVFDDILNCDMDAMTTHSWRIFWDFISSGVEILSGPAEEESTDNYTSQSLLFHKMLELIQRLFPSLFNRSSPDNPQKSYSILHEFDLPMPTTERLPVSLLYEMDSTPAVSTTDLHSSSFKFQNIFQSILHTLGKVSLNLSRNASQPNYLKYLKVSLQFLNALTLQIGRYFIRENNPINRAKNLEIQMIITKTILNDIIEVKLLLKDEVQRLLQQSVANNILDCLHDWFMTTLSKLSDPHLVQDEKLDWDVIGMTIDNALYVWKGLVTLEDDVRNIEIPIQLKHMMTHATLTSSRITMQMANILIQSTSTFIQIIVSNPKLLLIVCQIVLPAVLVQLHGSSLDEEYQLSMIRCLFLIYNAVAEETKEPLLGVLLPSLCHTIRRYQVRVLLIQLCGMGLTHMARLTPTGFRNQIGLLSEDDRMVLQQVMMSSLQQQQLESNRSVSTQASSFSLTPQMDSKQNSINKKLNLSKYTSQK